MKNQYQIINFIMVSGLNTLVGYSFYAVFIFMGMTYPLALFFATVVGVLFNFKTMGRLVFNNTNNNLFFKFALVYCFMYLFQIVIIGLMESQSANPYYAGLVTMILAAIITFVLNKLIVFRKNYEIN